MLKNTKKHINKKQQKIFINSEKPKDYFLSKKGGGKTYALCQILLNEIKTCKEYKNILLCSFNRRAIESFIKDFECIGVDFIKQICIYQQSKYVITTNEDVSHLIICFTYDDILNGCLQGYNLNLFDLVLRDNLERYNKSLVEKIQEIQDVIDKKNEKLLRENENIELSELIDYPTLDSVDYFNSIENLLKKTRDAYGE